MTPVRPPSRGVVCLPALDVRRRPDHRSELRSQLLLGEVVRRLGQGRDRKWWRVENLEDGYVGWVRTWGIVPAGTRRANLWRRRARCRVVRSHAEVRTGRGSGALVSPLFLNCRVIPGRSNGRFRWVELPDGRCGWIEARAIQVGFRGRPSLVERVLGLLGVPYLWGGRTPMGMDCSSFTQQVLLEQGVLLPRDADKQFRSASRLSRGQPPREGDLVFFGVGKGPVGHVGLALGGGYYAHSRGRVRINSTLSDNPLWDSELADQFRGFRRPLRRPLRGGPGGARRAESA